MAVTMVDKKNPERKRKKNERLMIIETSNIKTKDTPI